MHQVTCIPLGENWEQAFYEPMVAALSAGQSQEELWILPSFSLQKAVKQDLLARGMTTCQSPRLLNLDTWIGEIVRSSGSRHRLINRLTQKLLVERVVSQLAATKGLTYFKTIAAFPGFISAVTSLLIEIKQSGTTPEELANVLEAKGTSAKDREIFAIYGAYQACLTQLELADQEEMTFLALQGLQAGTATLTCSKLTILGYPTLNPLQLELVRQLRSWLSLEISLTYEKKRPEAFAAVEHTFTALVGMGFTPGFLQSSAPAKAGLVRVREHLFAPTVTTMETTGVAIVKSPSQEKELLVAAGEIKAKLLAGKYEPSEVAVILRNTALYSDFAHICARFQIPVNLPSQEKLASQPLVQLLEYALRAKMEQGSRTSVLNLIKSPLVESVLGIDADQLEVKALGKIINTWDDWLALEESKVSSQLGQLFQWVARLPARGTCGKIAEALRQFLDCLDSRQLMGEKFRQKLCTLDDLKAGLLAWEAVNNLLDQLEDDFAAIGQKIRSLSLEEFYTLFRQLVNSQTLCLQEGDARGIQVLSPLDVGASQFSLVYMLGMNDGEFPKAGRENWLYDDKERQLFNNLGLELVTCSHHKAIEDLYFAIAATRATAQVILSCRNDAQTLPSPYLEEIVRLFTPGTILVTEYGVNDLFPPLQDGIYSPQELLGKVLMEKAAKQCSDASLEQLEQFVFHQLVDEDFSRRVRELAGGDRQLGLVPAAVRRAAESEVFSITALEEYAQCPFAYFAKRLLKLKEWQEKEEEVGLDVIGTIYHEVLTNFLRQHGGERLRPQGQVEYQNQLLTILGDCCQQMIDAGKIIEGKGWQYIQQQLADVLDRWLDYEIAEENQEGLAFLPKYFEWGFGLPITEAMDQQSASQPLVLEMDAQQVNIVGKVDRIDQTGDKLAVVDYKRKRCPRFKDMEAGLDLQAGLYIMAVEQLLASPGKEVVGGGYYSIEDRKKEGGFWQAQWTEEITHRSAKKEGNVSAEGWQQVEAALRQHVFRYVEGIRAGSRWLRLPIAPVTVWPKISAAIPGRVMNR
jgi:ATP-dependent helicase/DNAse subunit B